MIMNRRRKKKHPKTFDELVEIIGHDRHIEEAFDKLWDDFWKKIGYEPKI